MITLFIQHGHFGHFSVQGSSQRCFTKENGYLNFLYEVTASFSFECRHQGTGDTVHLCSDRRPTWLNTHAALEEGAGFLSSPLGQHTPECS